MKINVKKTKVMCISRKGGERTKIYIDAQEVEQVQQFKYLDNGNGYCEQDLKSRIAMGTNAFMTKKTLLTSRMNLIEEYNSEMHGVEYGAVTRTMTQNHWRNLESFEMCIWRK